MSEYISKRDLTSKMCIDIDCETCPFYCHDCDACMFAQFVAGIPKADVSEVRRGHWSDISGQACLCSVCGRPQNYKQAMGWKYCPCCGAKMKEVEKNE